MYGVYVVCLARLGLAAFSSSTSRSEKSGLFLVPGGSNNSQRPQHARDQLLCYGMILLGTLAGTWQPAKKQQLAARERRYYFRRAKPVHRHETCEHAQCARNTLARSHITV